MRGGAGERLLSEGEGVASDMEERSDMEEPSVPSVPSEDVTVPPKKTKMPAYKTAEQRVEAQIRPGLSPRLRINTEELTYGMLRYWLAHDLQEDMPVEKPINVNDFKRMVEEGALREETLIMAKGMPAWSRWKDCKDIFDEKKEDQTPLPFLNSWLQQLPMAELEERCALLVRHWATRQRIGEKAIAFKKGDADSMRSAMLRIYEEIYEEMEAEKQKERAEEPAAEEAVVPPPGWGGVGEMKLPGSPQ